MQLTYDETIQLIRKYSGGRGVDWYPEYHQLILFQDCGNHTFNKNRWDNLDLSGREFYKALEVKEIEDGVYNIKELTKEEVERF